MILESEKGPFWKELFEKILKHWYLFLGKLFSSRCVSKDQTKKSWIRISLANKLEKKKKAREKLDSNLKMPQWERTLSYFYYIRMVSF